MESSIKTNKAAIGVSDPWLGEYNSLEDKVMQLQVRVHHLDLQIGAAK